MLNHNHLNTSHWWSFKLWLHTILTFLPRLWFVLCDCYSRGELHITSHTHWEHSIFKTSSLVQLLFISLIENGILCRHSDLQAQRQSRPFLMYTCLPKKASFPAASDCSFARLSSVLFHSHPTPIWLLSYPWKDISTGWATVEEILKTEFLVPLETCFLRHIRSPDTSPASSLFIFLFRFSEFPPAPASPGFSSLLPDLISELPLQAQPPLYTGSFNFHIQIHATL